MEAVYAFGKILCYWDYRRSFCFFLSVLHPSPAVDEYAGYERRFTFVCPLKWDYSAYGMEEAAKKYGVSMKYIRFERLNAEEQAEAIQEAILKMWMELLLQVWRIPMG